MKNSAILANSDNGLSNIVPLHTGNTAQDLPKRASARTASATTSAKPVSHFNYRGRRWRIFKRRNLTDEERSQRLPGPPWQIYFEHMGKRNLWSLKFAENTAALAEAKVMLDAYFDGKRENFRQVLKRPDQSACCTFGDIFASVHRLAIQATADSREQYVAATRHLLQLALDLDELEDVDKLTTGVLTLNTGRKIFATALANAARLESQAKQNSYRRSICSRWSLVLSLFGAASVVSMKEDLGLVLPDTIQEFRKAKSIMQFSVPEGIIRPPGMSVLRKTFREWLKLGRTPGYQVIGGDCRTYDRLAPLSDLARRNAFLALGLMFSCGLRCGEVPQIKGCHITRDLNGTARLDTGATVHVKNKSAVISVRPLDPFWSLMWRIAKENGWQIKPADYLLAVPEKPEIARNWKGGISYRIDWPFSHASKFLRSLGWNLQKSNHALRDCAASFVTMKFGLTRAKSFCRHSTIQTTEKHYGRFVRDDTMDNPNALKWLTWAK